MDRVELRAWIEDAITRHDRDVQERAEDVGPMTVDEIMDAVWGRLPVAVRREVSRANVQASLMMLTLRRGIATAQSPVVTPPELQP
jgi:hypothetical protein